MTRHKLLKGLVVFFACIALELQAKAETFEQAFAPIDVSGITIFIPIELKPDPSVVISIKETITNYVLEWSRVNSVTRYKLEQKIKGKWVVLNSNITSNQYQVGKTNGREFRISSCHRYGCSIAKVPNSIVNMPLFVSQFKANKTTYNKNESARISWNVQGASSVSLSSNKGARHNNLPLVGSLTLPVRDVTQVTLSASGFGQQRNQHIVLAKAAPIPAPELVSDSGYTQPLKNLKIKAIERTITPYFEKSQHIMSTGLQDTIFVASTNNSLYKISFDNSSSQIDWQRKLDGMVMNKPLIKNNSLYYSVSLMNGQGQICKTSIYNNAHQCTKLDKSVVASPVLLEQASLFSAKQRLLVFSVSGQVYELNDKLTVVQRLELPEAFKKYPLLTTPAINNKNQHIILRDAPDSLSAITIESPAGPVKKTFRAARSFISQGFDSSKNEAATSNTIKVEWQSTLEKK